ncbi:MAG: hypothetical protein CV089_06310 [Nitrospira sp. WS110]|nr:hypothetical protein [Nitrospira sp. WS110]
MSPVLAPLNLFIDRMIRAAKLDARLYEEVEADKGAYGQAMGVVMISSVASTIVRIFWAEIRGWRRGGVRHA